MAAKIKACDRFSHDELVRAFDDVVTQSDWTAPIDALIPMERRTVTACAIRRFTGARPTFRSDGFDLRVQAPGARTKQGGVRFMPAMVELLAKKEWE